MAHPVLVRAGDLPERLAEGRVEEQRVVAEPVLAPHALGDEPVHPLLRLEEHGLSAGHGQGAREVRAALLAREAAQLLEEEQVAVEVARPLAAEPAGVEAGGAAERVDREAGVVGDGQQPRVARVVQRLEDGVLDEASPPSPRAPRAGPGPPGPPRGRAAPPPAAASRSACRGSGWRAAGRPWPSPPSYDGGSLPRRRARSWTLPVVGAWRSLVAHLPWAQVVAGSNPAAPTTHEALARRRTQQGVRRTSPEHTRGWSASTLRRPLSYLRKYR